MAPWGLWEFFACGDAMTCLTDRKLARLFALIFVLSLALVGLVAIAVGVWG